MRIRNLCLGIAFVLLLVPLSYAQNGNSGNTIIAREKQFYDLLQAGRIDEMPAILDEDFTGVFGGGVLTKQDETEGWKAAVLDEYRFSNVIVKFPTADVATIIYRAYIKGSYKGKDITGDSYHTSTYVLKKGAWLMAMHTEVPVAKSSEKGEFVGISTAAYIVPDLDAAKKWYAEAFGVEPYFDEPFYVGFNINGFELGLMPEEETRVPGNTSIAYWAVSDLEKTFAKFTKLGAKKVEEPTDVGGGIKTAAVEDPWGNRIGLILNPTFDK